MASTKEQILAAGKTAFVRSGKAEEKSFEVPSTVGGLAFAPKGLRLLVEALGATVDGYSHELDCCGGAGGFMKSTPEQAIEFAKTKFDAILEETKADFIAVSCITCLMHMEKVQNTFNEQVGEERYKIPVFDYNQLLALCLGIDPKQVSAICNVPRDSVLSRLVPVKPKA